MAAAARMGAGRYAAPAQRQTVSAAKPPGDACLSKTIKLNRTVKNLHRMPTTCGVNKRKA